MVHESLAAYPVVIEIPVVWGEQDAFGHVNNVFYFRWCESARIVYGEKLGLMRMHRERNVGPIIAQIGCNFRKPVVFPDMVSIGARLTKVGRTSLTMEHVMVTPKLGIVADASSVLVMFDYNSGKPHPIPDQMRKLAGEIEGREFPAPQ